MSIILDGKKTALKLKEEIKTKLDKYYAEGYPKCNLSIVQVGKNPASDVYVRNKATSCEAVGMVGDLIKLDESITQKELDELIVKLSNDDSVHGVLVQLPLPKHLDEDRATELVVAKKDVDGFTTSNLGALVLGNGGYLSCTPGGIVYMLKTYGVELSGKNVVVIGRSKIVGKPMALALLNENATVTVCHSRTKNLAEISSQADIVIVAIGKPNFLKANMVKEGAIVVDVGINRTENGLVGDVDFAEVEPKSSMITPVPGGVGPMTVAYLMQNTLIAYEKAVIKK